MAIPNRVWSPKVHQHRSKLSVSRSHWSVVCLQSFLVDILLPGWVLSVMKFIYFTIYNFSYRYILWSSPILFSCIIGSWIHQAVTKDMTSSSKFSGSCVHNLQTEKCSRRDKRIPVILWAITGVWRCDTSLLSFLKIRDKKMIHKMQKMCFETSCWHHDLEIHRCTQEN